ncbi:MAG: hypothetical protein KKH94_04395, partial [Candidatus Omnitrophica bacterium]|nr:hypothetical protein [Candidatus Omnitrophota bacterium]
MRVSNIVRICCVVIISILSIGSFFWFSCLASPSDDCVVDAEFDLRFISGTNCVVEISAIPSKLITDKVYTHSDIVQASGEELGALKYAMFLMIEDQLDVLFQNAVVQNFSLPMHNNGVFTETIDVSLSPSFFNLNASVEIDTLIDGFLDLGASIRYFFPFPAERGWNNTFSIHLPMYMVFESANTIEVSQNGDVLTWRVNNWQGGNPQTAGEVLLREQSPTSNTSENEEIQITFKIDGRSVSNI